MKQLLIAQQPGLKAVPQEWISGDTLTVSTLNFSITAPPGWRWRQADLPDNQGAKNTGFFAIGPDDWKYAVIVWQRESQRSLQPADAQKFARGMAETMSGGWTPLDVQVRQSDIPIAGSAGFRTRLRGPDGNVYYQHGYMAPGRWSYLIFAIVPDETEPPAFSNFARSIRFLDSTGNAIRPPVGNSLILLAAIIGAVMDWRYIKSGGVRPTRAEKRYLVIAIGICLAALVVLGLLGRSAESLGSLTGSLTIWIFGVWEIARWRIRRSNAVPRIPPLRPA